MAGPFVEVRLNHIDLTRDGRRILRNVDWTIRPGERWLLVGENGAGKTQLLKLVSGAVWPSPTGKESRTYHWRGIDWLSPLEVQDEIGYVGPERQDKYERYDWSHSVTAIVGTGLYRTDIPLNPLTPEDHAEIAALLEQLAITHLAERSFLTLSYGERRLTLLARALASNPKLLLLDELLNGLDATNGATAKRWLESTGRSKMPWVLATHRIDDVPDVATHALVLDKGRVKYSGPVADAPLSRLLPTATSSPAVVKSRRKTGAMVVRLTRATVYVDEARILRNISFEVSAGDCWIVHGPNGSGKSTLLRTLYGDHAVADTGRIERAGIEPGVHIDVFKKRVGFVAPHLQSRHPQEMTVAEVVQSGRYASIGLNDEATETDREAAQSALDAFGIGGFGSRTLRELSYGQLRRVLFARAWVNRPKLLLLDEALAGIDAPTRSDLLARLEKSVAKGVAIVMATHHREEWPACANHEIELADGKVRRCR